MEASPPLDAVKRSYLVPERRLPLVIEPSVDGLNLADFAAGHRSVLEKELLDHGAILFRGFGILEPESLEAFATAVCSSLFDENGEHPHDSVSGNVYTPVFYSPAKKLLWHNENSFNYRWPRKIMFCCVDPADEGGETPIVDSRAVFAAIDPEVRRRFMKGGLIYSRNYGEGLGLDWTDVFHTEDRGYVEEYCRQNDLEFEWREDGGLRTRCRRPSVIRHPETGDASWFNQAQHWHLACLDSETRTSLEYIFEEEDLPRNCFFGNGDAIPDSDMEHIMDVYERLEVAFPWQAGDVLLVDNILCAHARNPYSGDRKLLVAMGDMASYQEVAGLEE